MIITTAACAFNQNFISCPPEGVVLAPFVTVTIIASGVTITVGNESSPANKNTAIIKDFEFGHSNGIECRFHIYDEQGSSFSRFVEHLLKDFKCLLPQNGYKAKLRFGWIATYCDGGTRVLSSPDYYLILTKLNCVYGEGKFIYEVEAKDITATSFQAKHSVVYGGDAFKDAITVKEAITKMFQDPKHPPVVSSVKFLRAGKRTTFECNNKFVTPKDIEFKDAEFKGKFPGNNLSKIDLAMKWLADFLSEDGKAFVPVFNPEVEGGELIFWETLKPGCKQSHNWSDYSVGTYLVNGGPKSNVLQFTPKLQWHFTPLTNASGQIGVNPKEGDKNNAINCATLNTNIVQVSEIGVEAYVPTNERIIERDASGDKKEAAKARQQQLLAMQPFRLNATMPIEADLVIVGDPFISRPSLCIVQRNVHIIFMNPYHCFGGQTFGSGEALCGQWYVLGPLGCNPIYSNKAWIIKNVVHRISGGKFTTTFSLWLPAPGVDIDVGSPLGGEGSGGWVPPINC